MPQLLLELFSEAIRMQQQAARDLERMARERLAAASFAATSEKFKAFAGPRRLTSIADGPRRRPNPDRNEERKGPRANAPAQAIEGFLRSTGRSREPIGRKGQGAASR